MKGYPLVQLYQEMSFIAYHFHWSCEELMTLEHNERRRWCKHISRINQRHDEKPKTSLNDIGMLP